MAIEQKVRNAKAGLVVMIFYAILFMVLSGCTGLQPTDGPVETMTPKKMGIVMMESYNIAYADYMDTMGFKLINDKWEKVKKVSLTNYQKKKMNTKKELLIQVWPLLKSYNLYVDLNEIPPDDLVAEIFDILDAIELLLN